jgi:hypothetical protein
LAEHQTLFTDEFLAIIGKLPDDQAQKIIKLGTAIENEKQFVPIPVYRLFQIVEHTRRYQTAVIEANYPLGFVIGSETEQEQRSILQEHRNTALKSRLSKTGIVEMRYSLKTIANTSFVLSDDGTFFIDDVEWKKKIWTPLYRWVERGYNFLFGDLDCEDWPTCIPEEDLVKWQDKRQEIEWQILAQICKLMPNDAANPLSSEAKKPTAKKGKAAPKRSWTQVDLNAAILKYKAERASQYNDMLNAIKYGKKGAKLAARKMFGRNATASALGVKAKAMVSKSPEWKDIAKELQLDGKSYPAKMRKRIGLCIAESEKSEAGGDTTIDTVIRNETISLIKNTYNAPQDKPVADDLIAKLEAGKISDDHVREFIEIHVEQQKDQKKDQKKIREQREHTDSLS